MLAAPVPCGRAGRAGALDRACVFVYLPSVLQLTDDGFFFFVV